MSLRERLAGWYADAHALNSDTLVRLAEPMAGATFLDVGCGDGELSARVARRVGPARAIAVDLDTDALAVARARGLETLHADIDDTWPLEDASVDVVHSNQVIEHLCDTDNFLAEIRRVLRPGGYALISTNNLASWHNIASLTLGWQPPPAHVSDLTIVGNPFNFMEGDLGERRARHHRRLFTGRALRELAAFHGLRAELDVAAGYYPLPRPLARVAARIDPLHAAYLIQRYRPA